MAAPWDDLRTVLGDTAIVARWNALVAQVEASVSSLLGSMLIKSNNLSDVGDVSMARTNLGLGTAATQSTSTFATALQGTKADGAMQRANNLSDVGDVSTARSNLGLGTAAMQSTSTFATAAQGALASTALQPKAVNYQTGTNYTVQASDASGLVDHVNASAITVTLAVMAGDMDLFYQQMGAGQVTFSAYGASLFHPDGHTKTRKQGAAVWLRYRASSAQWVLGGDTAA